MRFSYCRLVGSFPSAFALASPANVIGQTRGLTRLILAVTISSLDRLIITQDHRARTHTLERFSTEYELSYNSWEISHDIW
jgi:hypothetical protein